MWNSSYNLQAFPLVWAAIGTQPHIKRSVPIAPKSCMGHKERLPVLVEDIPIVTVTTSSAESGGDYEVAATRKRCSLK